jgi:hypothetical protein
MERYSIIGDEWLLGQDKYLSSTVVLKHPTTLYAFSNRNFQSLSMLLGSQGIEAWQKAIQVGARDRDPEELPRLPGEGPPVQDTAHR